MYGEISGEEVLLKVFPKSAAMLWSLSEEVMMCSQQCAGAWSPAQAPALASGVRLASCLTS